MDKDEARLRVMEHALEHIPFDGWTDAALARGAVDAGYAKEDIVRLFPGGVIDALDWFTARADGHMVEAYAALPKPPEKIRDKITALVRLRLSAYTGQREAVKRGAAAYSLPHHAHRGVAALARTVDEMWHAAGDRSADFSWYTRRATLAAVYSATLLYWLNDESEGFADTWAFLSRRIDNVMRFEKFKAGVRSQVSGLSKIFSSLKPET